MFLSYNDDQSISNYIINSIFKCWDSITSNVYLNVNLKQFNALTFISILFKVYLIDLLKKPMTNEDDNDLIDTSLKFYAIYLSKITNDINSTLADSVTLIYDEQQQQLSNDELDTAKSIGTQLCELLIKQFDKNCLTESNSILKVSIFNALKCLFVFSNDAKVAAINCKYPYFMRVIYV